MTFNYDGNNNNDDKPKKYYKNEHRRIKKIRQIERDQDLWHDKNCQRVEGDDSSREGEGEVEGGLREKIESNN